MPNSKIPYENVVRQYMKDESHYVTSISTMADRKAVTSREDIYDENGVKLVAKGISINSSLREYLLKYKLFKPIDHDLILEQAVTPDSLAKEANQLLESQAYLRQLASGCVNPQAMHDGLAWISLPPQMAFKLTVVKEERPQLFRHLLLVSLIAHYLAINLQMDEKNVARLLAAALFHDLGELYTDPAILDPGHVISDQERRYVYVHPITGYLIASGVSEVEPVICHAILQHQERLDGSGYPCRLRGDQIGKFARILGVADVCASILDKHSNMERLGALLQLNWKKYDTQLLSLLQKGIVGHAILAAPDYSDNLTQLKAVAHLLELWGEFCVSFERSIKGELPQEIRFIFERMVVLRTMLLEFGFDPDGLENLIAIARTDTKVAAELVSVLDEIRWQFANLDHEIQRHLEEVAPVLSKDNKIVFDYWVSKLHLYQKV